MIAFSPISSQESSRKQKTHESGKRRGFWWDCWLVVVLLFICASVQAVFAESLGGVVSVQWSAGRVCACVCESVCVCVKLARACALDHGIRGHVVCRRRRKTQ